MNNSKTNWDKTKWDINEMLNLIKQLGHISLKYYKNNTQTVKKDNTIVTQADIEIEQIITDTLEDTSLGIHIIGEETISKKDWSYISNALENTAYIIDPIDGTVPYANGLHTWGISIGYAYKGKISQGAVLFPVLNQIYITDQENVYFGSNKDWDFSNLKKIEKSHLPWNKHQIISSTRINKNVIDYIEEGNPVHLVGSCVYSMCSVISGGFHIYIGRFKIWDWAACLAMCEKLSIDIIFENSQKVDTQINSKNYILEQNNPNNWKMLDTAYISNSLDAIKNLKN